MHRLAYKLAVDEGFSVWSQSKIQMFDCPRAGYLKYVERRPEPESEPARFGALLHAAIATTIQSGTDIDPDEAVAEAAQEVLGVSAEQIMEARDLLSRLDINVRPERLIGVEEEIICSLSGNRKFYVASDLPDVEEPEIDRPLSGERVFYAALDVLEIEDRHAIITDWKTDRATRTRDDVSRDLQVRSYAWAVFDEYPFLESVTVTMYFVRYNQPVSVSFLREDVSDVGKFLDARTCEIEARIADPDAKWPPAPGDRCRFCPYSLDCPAVQNGKAAPMVRSHEEALAVAAELAAAERRITVLKDALKPWVNQHGSVEVGGEVWSFWPSSWYELRPGVLEEFIRLLKEKGRVPDPYLKPNGKTVSSLLEDPDLAAMIVRKSFPRFESRKA